MSSDPAALRQRLRRLFLEELEENLRVLTEGLARLEREPSSGETVNGLFRAAHSLKGAAHSAAVPEALETCHRMESTFAALRAGEIELVSEVVDALYADVAVLTELARALAAVESAGPSVGGASRPASSDALAPTGTGPADASAPSTVRVSVEKLDALVAGARATLTTLSHIVGLSADAGQLHGALTAHARRLQGSHLGSFAGSAPARTTPAEDRELTVALDISERASRAATIIEGTLRDAAARLADAAQRLRMEPFGEVCQGLDLAVRTIAVPSGKEVRLAVRGAEIEVDRGVTGALREPLLHLVRNAVDHGIEPAEARVAAGKPRSGTIAVEAALLDGGLRVSVRDDGKGVDLEALRSAAARSGAVAADGFDLAFVAGVSTAATVTEVSGRGMGLDAVRERVERLGGSVELTSKPGVGTEIVLTAPVLLVNAHLLLVAVAGEVLALPVAGVRQLVHVPVGELHQWEGRSTLVLEGRTVTVVSLAGLLGFDAAATPAHGDRLIVACLNGQDVGVVVDELLDDIEAVVQPLPRRLEGMPGVIAGAVLPDGRVALVMSPSAIARQAADHPAAVASPGRRRAPRILLVEDTATTRVLERTILENAGYHVTVAVDGADAWALLQDTDVDLIVSDVNMPRKDGLELCAAVRASARHRDVPVVLVTSLASDADRGRGAEVGADAYLVKSAFDQELLLGTVERLL